ncbi:MAG: FG-GAP-like repeat-containing protein [Planctomycetota bacterium]
MDLNADGYNDVITGSYWPGDIYLFSGKAGGFAKGEFLKDASGKNVNGGQPWKTKDDPDMDSLAAAPHAADLDGDGDYDLLIGNFVGRVMFIENIGTKTAPKFSDQKRALQAANGDLKVEGDAGPVAVDWNADGRLDLIVGAGDGAVRYFQNDGTPQAPKFAAGVDLLPAVKVDYEHPELEGTVPKSSGTRTKVCVTDYNGDGQLDLLVGDYASQSTPEPNLTPAQIAERDALHAERDKLSDEMGKLYEGGAKPDEAATKQLSDRMKEVFKKLEPLEAQHKPHGWVWLYLRKAATTASKD